MRSLVITFIGLATISGWAANGYAQAVVTGTGSSFAAPLYTRWAQDAQRMVGLNINYQGTGSGEGQKQILAGTVDFAGSDAPMDPAQLRSAGILQFPAAVGGVDIMVNLPGIGPGRLKLTGPLLADIYMGAIRRWNDPRITRANPGLMLPSLPILAVHHANASGTTFAVSRYLAKVSPAWKAGMGIGLLLNWPTGSVGAKGSSGAAAEVGRWPGAIGYAEHSYVALNHLASVLLLNRAGQYVAPGPKTFAMATTRANWDASHDFAVDLTDSSTPGAWPIVTATFVLVPKSPAKADATRKVVKFFSWAFAKGDPLASNLQYVPLPTNAKAQVMSSWKLISANR